MYLTDLEVFILVWDFINTHTLYFGVSNIECEGESVHLYRLVVAFIAQWCYKYQNLVCRPKYLCSIIERNIIHVLFFILYD